MTLSPKALAKWQWSPGMRGYRPGSQNALTPFRVADDDDCARFAGCIPDLTDPVTVDGLARVVRKVWRDPAAYIAPAYIAPDPPTRFRPVNSWRVYIHASPVDYHSDAPTEPDAWIAALEAAP